MLTTDESTRNRQKAKEHYLGKTSFAFTFNTQFIYATTILVSSEDLVMRQSVAMFVLNLKLVHVTICEK